MLFIRCCYLLAVQNAAIRHNIKNKLINKNMEYHGKLYGKIGNKYFDTSKTSEDLDKLESQLSIEEQQNEMLIQELKSFKIELEYDLPENMPLYKDSGLWQLRSDCMNEVFLQQKVHESFFDFLDRCKQYNREEILKP